MTKKEQKIVKEQLKVLFNKFIKHKNEYKNKPSTLVAGAKEMQEENEQLKKQVSYLKDNLRYERKKLFDILTDYEIGNYDNNIHQFYEDVYDVHNELMEVEE